MSTLQRFARRIPLSVIPLLIIFAGAAYAIASDGMTASQNTPISITGPDGICKKITNNSATGLSEYIPTASTAEWQSFVANPPAGVTLAACTYTWTWTDRSSAGSRNWYRIASSADGTKLAAILYNATGLYTSTDSGATWVQHSYAAMNIALTADGSKILIAPEGGNISVSTDSGGSWTSLNSGGHYWRAFAISPDASYIIGGDDGNTTGYLYSTSNSGASWSTRSSAGSRTWLAATVSSDGTKVAAAAYGGNIYTSTDGGATWTARTGAGSRNWYALDSTSDGTTIVGVPYGGYPYISHDSGATWTQLTAAGSRNWTSITTSSDGTRIAAASWGGYIYISMDSGTTWTAQTAAGSHSWFWIASSADGLKLAAVISNGDIWTAIAQ